MKNTPPVAHFGWIRQFLTATITLGWLLVAKPVQADSESRTASACELWMSLQYHNGTSSLTPQIDSERVCIKYNGNPIAIPQTHYLEITNASEKSRFFRYFCRDKQQKIPNTRESYKCEWNQRFHNYYPFTITISKGVRVAENTLSTYIQAIRVFRNGELAYSWIATEDGTSTLTIPGEGLTADRLPYLAEFDFRIIPRGLTVKPEILEQRVNSKHRDWKSEAERITGAAWLALPDATQHALQNYRECFRGYTATIYQIAGKLSGNGEFSELSLTQATKKACEEVAKANAGYPGTTELVKLLDQSSSSNSPSLRDLLDRVRKAELRTADEVRRAFRDALAKLDTKAHTDVVSEVEKLLAAISKQSLAPASSSLIIAVTNEMRSKFDDALIALRSTQGLVDVVVQDALVPLADPANQARLFARFADGLGNESTFFEPRGHNPQTLPGEQALLMDYVDPHQFYIFAPWHMLALRWGQNPGTTIGAENLLPAIDAVGYRYQWARSRFADLRLGLGGAFIKDNLQVPDPANAGQTIEKDFYNFSVHLSVGLGSFKLGVGYIVTNNGIEGKFFNQDRIRLLLGLDIVKLLSGRNVEIL